MATTNKNTPEIRPEVLPSAMPDDDETKREAERQACFQDAVNERMQIPTRYEKVAVLVVRWHDEVDSFKNGHDVEIERLRNLFCDKFHYEFEEVKLDTAKKPQNAFNHAITDHINKHDGPHNLLIVVYTGHGQVKLENQEERLELSANGRSARKTGRYAPTAYWDEAERPLLTSAESDVLAILDCCFASNAQKGPVEARRTYELLAASPPGQSTPAPGPKSFTTAVIDTLEDLLAKYGNKNITTTKLWDAINRKRVGGVPSMLWDRLHKHERHVQLAPLDPQPKNGVSFELRSAEKAWLNLRFSLEHDSLSQEQIESFARELPTACSNASIPVRRIDWIKMESCPPLPPFHVIVNTAMTAQMWKRKTQTSARANFDATHYGGSPTSKRLRTNESSPTSVQSESSGSNTMKEPLALGYDTLSSPDSVELLDSGSD